MDKIQVMQRVVGSILQAENLPVTFPAQVHGVTLKFASQDLPKMLNVNINGATNGKSNSKRPSAFTPVSSDRNRQVKRAKLGTEKSINTGNKDSQDMEDKKVQDPQSQVKHVIQRGGLSISTHPNTITSTTEGKQKTTKHVCSHVCVHCGKKFQFPSSLRTHMKIHSDKKPYRCNVCKRGFNTTGNLNTHMMIHTGERPYGCKVCWKRFTRSNHLTEHMRMHTGERPFKCSVCSRGFASRSNLKNHHRVHTGEKPFTCPICGRGFTQRSNMKSHISHVHVPKKSTETS